MKNSDKLGQIINILKNGYNGKMSDEIIYAFADKLYDSLFVEQHGLDDVFAIVSQYEDEKQIEESNLFYVFSSLYFLLHSRRN